MKQAAQNIKLTSTQQSTNKYKPVRFVRGLVFDNEESTKKKNVLLY